MPRHDDIQHLDPDQLLTGFSRTPFLGTFLLSILAHVLIIGGLSMTPLLAMVLPSDEPSAELPASPATSPATESPAPTSPAPSTTPAATPPPAGSRGAAAPSPAPALEAEESNDTAGETDDFDIDLNILNQ